MNPATAILGLSLLTPPAEQPRVNPRLERSEILRLLGLAEAGKNPDLKPGLHGARLLTPSVPITFRPSDLPVPAAGRVVCQIFLKEDGSIDRVLPLYGPTVLRQPAADYARLHRFAPDSAPASLYNIYLCFEVSQFARSVSTSAHLSTGP
jgi:hypothetical protein